MTGKDLLFFVYVVLAVIALVYILLAMWNYFSTASFDQTLFDNYSQVARVAALGAIAAATGVAVLPAGY